MFPTDPAHSIACLAAFRRCPPCSHRSLLWSPLCCAAHLIVYFAASPPVTAPSPSSCKLLRWVLHHHQFLESTRAEYSAILWNCRDLKFQLRQELQVNLWRKHWRSVQLGVWVYSRLNVVSKHSWIGRLSAAWHLKSNECVEGAEAK